MKNFLKGSPGKSLKTASRIIDGEAVIVIPEKGVVNILNLVGSRIWELLDGKNNSQDIARIISQEFEVADTAAHKDVQEFIQELSDKGLITFN
jgi:hypothetical protein